MRRPVTFTGVTTRMCALEPPAHGLIPCREVKLLGVAVARLQLVDDPLHQHAPPGSATHVQLVDLDAELEPRCDSLAPGSVRMTTRSRATA